MDIFSKYFFPNLFELPDTTCPRILLGLGILKAAHSIPTALHTESGVMTWDFM